MSDAQTTIPSWNSARSRLCQAEPGFYELEPGGALALQLGKEGWMLELTPDGRMICQTGMDMDDIKSLLSDGTPEDLGTDELAKQAKYYLQPAVSKVRKTLLGAGFEETTEMTDEYVAITFHKTVDFEKLDDVQRTVRWCQEQFTKKT
ncbi:MAG: hypothetical protein E6K69_06815 [Nitrospirae bacterium]|nr:MAG: hypothetical protein E6K69_06815 [Nitrospirota bacterium]